MKEEAHCSDDCGADLHSLALLSPKERFELPRWLSGKGSACQARDMGQSPGSGGSPEEGNGNPLQYSCLGNAVDRGVWWVSVHGTPKIWHNWVTNTFTVNEQPLGKRRHWITSTDHQRLQPQPDLGCEVTQPRHQKHEMKKRSNECLCPVSSALRYVRLSPFYKMTFGVPAAVGSLASIR